MICRFPNYKTNPQQKPSFRAYVMKCKSLLLPLRLALVGAAFAGSYRVTYTHRGLVQRITVQAESTQEARRTVQAIIPGEVVTGAHRVK